VAHRLPDRGAKAPSKDVKVAARKEQISDRTLQRAAQQVRVEYVQEGFPRSTCWRLPDSHATMGATDPRHSDRGATESQSRQSRHGSETGRDCTVCARSLLFDVPGRTVCSTRDDAHTIARLVGTA